MAKILLKARPTAEQVADRLAPPLPDGLEFYLDLRDISGEDWLEPLVDTATSVRLREFEYVVEGPLRSFDGAFFDVTNFNKANRTVLDRLMAFGARVGARAAVIHAMAARPSALSFTAETRAAALEAALPLFRYYASACQEAGIVPTVENVPPVARMREDLYMFSQIGTMPADILFLMDRTPGLRATLDVSHAQLYVNAFNTSDSFDAGRANGNTTAPADLRPMVAFLQSQPGVSTIDGFIDVLAERLTESHISNARGLLGEGLPYGEGDIDLDHVVARLSSLVSFLVTETIEPDPVRAVFMRHAQARIDALIARENVQ